MVCEKKIVVLGTGGTIAGTADSKTDTVGYRPAQVGVAQLLQGLPHLTTVLGSYELVSEQVAQVDSKDMSFAIWRQLAERVNHYLQQADVSAVVMTHGTDTLEETAYFLDAVLPAAILACKPVVLTGAMRTANALMSDGQQNLLDAVTVAMTEGACGVMVQFAGILHSAVHVQKVHTYRLDAFGSGDVGPLGHVENGRLFLHQNWPVTHASQEMLALEIIAEQRVEIVMSHAGCSGAVVDALLQPSPMPLRGLVVAGTGNGTLHHKLEAALLRAVAAGVKVLVASRCPQGRVATRHGEFASAGALSPVKARVALMLALMAESTQHDLQPHRPDAARQNQGTQVDME
jgi:L-asparaginase